MIKVLDIIAGTAVDGPGLRTSIYFSGCTHQCEGCHNPQSWDFNAGKDMTEEEIIDIVEENGFNVTFTGGDPMCRAAALVPLAKELKSRGYNIWCYTGYTFGAAGGHSRMHGTGILCRCHCRRSVCKLTEGYFPSFQRIIQPTSYRRAPVNKRRYCALG